MLDRLAERLRLRTFSAAPVRPASAVGAVARRDFSIGETVRGRVDSVLPRGEFKVLIDDQPFVLHLPGNAQPGDVVRLTVTAREPKLKFALEGQLESAGLSTRLSDTGRFITALLAESEKLPLSAITRSAAPLLSAPPENGAALASALRSALADSGMFYESHQAQWIAGERPLAMLKNEPQAQFPPAFSESTTTVPFGAENSDGSTGLPELPVYRDALPIVRQQLETLDTRNVAWQGLIWPDQPLEWQISEQPPHTGTSPDEPQWQTHIRLTLPQLGALDATLRIGKHGVTIAVHTALANAAAALTTERARLQQSLHDAGVTALDIRISTDAAT